MKTLFFKNAPKNFPQVARAQLESGKTKSVIGTFMRFRIPVSEYRLAFNQLVIGCSLGGQLDNAKIESIREEIWRMQDQGTSLRSVDILAKAFFGQMKEHGYSHFQIVRFTTRMMGLVIDDMRREKRGSI